MMLAVVASVVSPPPARAQIADEYELKAEFVARFAHFVTWDPKAFAGADSPIMIGVLGDDPFGRALDRACAGERTADGRGLKVKRSRNPGALADCQIVFVSGSERGRLGGVLNALGRDTLTVGDWAEFSKQGGVIAFHADGARIRIAISQGAATKAGLKLSSKLLHLSGGNN